MLTRTDRIWRELNSLDRLRSEEAGRLAAGRQARAEPVSADAALLAMLQRNGEVWQNLAAIDAARDAAGLPEGALGSTPAPLPNVRETPEDMVLAMLARTDRIWRELALLDALRGDETAKLTAGRTDDGGNAREPEAAILAMLGRDDRMWQELAELDAWRTRQASRAIAGGVAGATDEALAAEATVLAMLARTDRIWRELGEIDRLRAQETAQLAAARPSVAPAPGTDGATAEARVLSMLARQDQIWADLAAVDRLRQGDRPSGDRNGTVAEGGDADEGVAVEGAAPRPATASTAANISGTLGEAEYNKLMELYERTLALDRALQKLQEKGASSTSTGSAAQEAAER